ncbi:MAG: phosphoenolpyruvate synthase regulatory protein [Candidatus Cloacimonadota bacterium]|nr:MAG: phosphoenolpyruvate synthase regulatory protein [Candidatus Cloacimonadota bacterium]
MKITKFRHIFIVSDATGSTCEIVVKAALTQFSQTKTILHKKSRIRNVKQVKEIIKEAEKVDGVIVHTLVSSELRNVILDEGRKHAVPTIDIFGPILARFSNYLEISPMAIPGLFRNLDKDYYKRIDNVNYAVKHDDGRNLQDLSSAEIILLGVSRTSKTPISMYLSFRGYKVANIPIIYNIPVAPQLLETDSKKIVGLTIQPFRLQLIRKVRADKFQVDMHDYTELDTIRNEVNYALSLFRQHNYSVVDVTAKSIEEAAGEVMRIVSKRNQCKINSEL